MAESNLSTGSWLSRAQQKIAATQAKIHKAQEALAPAESEAAPAPAPDTHVPTGEHFGHQPRNGKLYGVSFFSKMPVWADTREKISPEQWHQMPPSEQETVLAEIPHDSARELFKSLMQFKPAVKAFKQELADQKARKADAPPAPDLPDIDLKETIRVIGEAVDLAKQAAHAQQQQGKR